MGQLIRISCHNCDYSREFSLGQGILYDHLSHYLVTSRLAGKQMQDELLALLERKTFSQVCDHRLFRCAKCGTIAERFYARVGHARGTYSTRHRCLRCNKYLEELPLEGIGGTSCPRCREVSLGYSVTGHWD